MSQRPRIVVELRGDRVLATADEVTLGGRTGNDVVVDDVAVADRHCRFAWEDGFRVRDLGSVTGTWVDGERALPSRELRDGGEIVVGTTRIGVAIADVDGARTLTLDVKPQTFWWKKPGKGVFDNDPDAMVRAEVGFGRFPTLTLGNRIALVVGAVLLLAATFVGTVMGRLADAGPLAPPHAFVTSANADATTIAGAHADFAKCKALADAQGCSVCHTTGQGAVATKCLQCHADLQAPATRRHPYLGDGVLQNLPGVAVSEALCVVCHRDHQGGDWLKPAADALLGKCDACHGDGKNPVDRQALTAKAPVVLPPTRRREYATYRFPHDQHLAKGIDCAVCHHVDPEVAARRAAGAPHDPLHDDFADVPFATCRQCHVPDAAPTTLTAAQQQQWRAKDHQWQVRWHGTENGGEHCAACHAKDTRDGRTVFGPELLRTARPRQTAAQYAAERARYRTATRRHQDEFAAHAAGKLCTSCHLNGDVAATTAEHTFWHALHVADGALRPRLGEGASISGDTKVGCASCHGDLAKAKTLTPAGAGAFHWSGEAKDQTACRDCHRESDGVPLPLQPVTVTIAAGQQAMAAEFPHDVHLACAAYGKAGGVLAEGCFACHEFERPAGRADVDVVPRTKPGAADCTACHAGHDHVGGGTCRECHPADPARSNSFLVAGAVKPGTSVGGREAPAPPQRDWPGASSFSHLSRGHSAPDLKCSDCHRPGTTEQAKDLATVPVPDEAVPACRECHLQRQFHWR